MTDYLANLVKRSLAPTGIRPRSRSLFEPVKGALRANEFAFEKHTTLEKPTKGSDVAPARASAPSRAEAAMPAQAGNLQRADATADAHVAAVPRSQERAAPVHIQNAAPNPLHPSPSNVRVEEPARMDRSIAPRERWAEAPRRDSERKPEGATMPTTIAGPERARVEPSAVSIREVRTEKIAEPGPSTFQPVVRIPVPPRPVVTQATKHERKEPATAPEIHIVIGRVVVHADAPAVARLAPAPRSYEPRVSLDQYLRSRGGTA